MLSVPDRPWWHALAACRGAGTQIFYPTRHDGVAEALAYCQRCPVRDHCLEHALTTGDTFGIWALPERQRRRLRRARRLAAAELAAEPAAPDDGPDGVG